MTDEAVAAAPGIEIGMERVLQMIPHRDPFLMIDKVINTVANESATGIKEVRADEYYFKGHFPARPVMPGVLIVEAMAQTAAVLVVHTLGREAEGKLVYFMSIDEARFRRPVVPGDRLLIHVTKQRNRRNVWRFEGKAEVDGHLAAEAVFAAMILDE